MCEICCDIFYCNRCFQEWQRTKLNIRHFVCDTCWDDEFDDSDFDSDDYDSDEDNDFLAEDILNGLDNDMVIDYLTNLRRGLSRLD